MTKLDDHLGGHNNVANLDLGALSALHKVLNPKSFLDVGCGLGGMVEVAEKEYGMEALGIDGDHTIDRYDNSKFIIHDFTKGPVPLEKTYDLGWSVEFVEHVYEKYIPEYITSFQACKVMVITYAPVGWGGHHHVNELDEAYWIRTMASYKFRYDEALTKLTRKESTLNCKYHKKGRKAFVKNRGLVFINDN